MRNLSLIILILMALVTTSCVKKDLTANEPPNHYTIKRTETEINIDADWNKPEWSKIPAQKLGYFMGEKPEHFPNTQFKVAYDNENIYVIFKVEDQYVRAVGKGYQASVYRDSCVEFFFTPDEDTSKGYFNLETNCGGTILMYHQISRGLNPKPLAEEDLDKIQIAHSLPKLIEEEITAPTEWTLEYKLPISILQKYTDVKKPASGVTWKANFYKCGDQTSHPHWLTWSFVDKPIPDFHRPDFFGTIKFE